MTPIDRERKALTALQSTTWTAHRIADWLGLPYQQVVNIAVSNGISLEGRR